MTVFNWPDMLPCMQRSSYGLAPAQGAMIRTEMENGIARQRPTTKVQIAILSAMWRFTPKEMAVFSYFYQKILLNGSQTFNTTILTGTGLSTVPVRFMPSGYKSRLAGARWEVTAELEVLQMPQQLTDAEWVLVSRGIDLESLQ